MGSLREKTTDFFEKAKILYMGKAQKVAGEEGQLKKLIKSTGERMEMAAHHPTVQSAIEPLRVFVRMLIAHKNQQFNISNKTLGLIVLGLVYFVTPVDIIPDFLPVLGYADDLSVLIAVYNSVKHEVEAFIQWEKTSLKSPSGNIF